MIRSGKTLICKAAEGAGYALILPIFFECGAGVTRSISSERVSFVTAVDLAPEERLSGSLRFPPTDEAVGTVLHYQARIVSVQRSDGEGLFHVTARFELLSFAPERRA